MPKIILDAMGSDNFPTPEIEAANQLITLYNEELILVGDESLLAPKVSDPLIRIVHAPDVFKMTDKVAKDALKQAKNSMAVAMQLLKSGEGDAFVTMGNTGGAMANGLYQLRRLRGVKRPGLMASVPVKNGTCLVIDIGANVECRPDFLLQFAMMSSLYAEAVLGVKSPRVGLLSNGEEAGKGNDLVKAAYPLLEASGLNFIGNVEGKELFGGEADVVVTDGFTGNILIKSSEAVAKLITEVLREQLMTSTRTKLGGLLAKPAFSHLKQLLDPAEIGAAPLMGLNGLVFVGHGRSQAKAVVSAVQQARKAVDADLLNLIRTAIESGL